MGYWHAKIDGEEKPRVQEYIDSGVEPEMPDMAGIASVFSMWRDCGLCDPDGGPLRWSEIEAFARMHGATADECIIMRDMSLAYCDGLKLTSYLSISPMEKAAMND